MGRSNFIFNNAPILQRKRAIFDLSHTLFTDFNVGTLKPIYLQEVYPGDQINLQTDGVIRNVYPFLKPIMDNIFIDNAYFFVPYRLVYSDWEDTITGGSEPDDWVPSTTKSVPTYTGGSVAVNSVLDAIGVPPGSSPKDISVLPARAFALIWNQYFRDENVENSCLIQKGDLGESENPNSNDWSPSNYTGMLPKVNKLKDYFTTALRSTQKGLPVDIPINVTAPDFTPLTVAPSSATMTPLGGHLRLGFTGGTLSSNSRFNLGATYAGGSGYGYLSVFPGDTINSTENYKVNSTNLGISGDDLTISTSNALTVNDLRYAFAVQKILERSARSGSRYVEYIHAAFGVNSPDARLQRVEYLGGKSTPLNIQQVANTFSSGDAGSVTTNVGNLSAYSLTNQRSRVSKAFTEHGYIIGVAWFRQFHTYQQGVEAFLYRKNRLDFYDPALAYIGEQPIYQRELYNFGDKTNSIFGYKEAWSELRYRPNRVSGLCRSGSDSTFLDFYHLGDFYSNAPTLSASFINETPDFVWRSVGMSAPDANESQFVVDFRFTCKMIRAVPPHSPPSLIDHN